MEVIYTGLHQTPDQIVDTVVQEDPDALCLSILSGAHNALFPVIMEKFRANNIDDVLVMGGGIIPDDDIPDLEKIGVEGFFGPGAKLADIVHEDFPLTAKLLRMANSGQYGRIRGKGKGDISTIRETVMLLGFEAVKRAVKEMGTCEDPRWSTGPNKELLISDIADRAHLARDDEVTLVGRIEWDDHLHYYHLIDVTDLKVRRA